MQNSHYLDQVKFAQFLLGNRPLVKSTWPGLKSHFDLPRIENFYFVLTFAMAMGRYLYASLYLFTSLKAAQKEYSCEYPRDSDYVRG